MALTTVIIPAYNCAGFVAEAVGSLMAQTTDDWECVVVDDGSTDGTGAAAAAYGDPRVFVVRQDNAGVSAARNHGLRRARGRFCLFLDADDTLHPAALHRLAAALEAAPDAAACFGPVVNVLLDGRVQPGQKPLARHRYPSGDVLAAMLGDGFLNVGQVLMRTAAARSAGGFRTDLALSEDWEFLCRLAATGPCLFIGPGDEILRHRLRPGSASDRLAARWENHRAVLEALHGNPDFARRLGAGRWRAVRRRAEASVLWEVGRVNFCDRNFTEARRFMVRSLRLQPRPKRLALFALALLSRALDRPLAARLRFNDLDRPGAGDPATAPRAKG